MKNDVAADSLNRAAEAVWSAYFHATWPLLLTTFLAAIGVMVLSRVLWAARRGMRPSLDVALGARLSSSERKRVAYHGRVLAQARRRLRTLHKINPRLRPAAAMDYLRKVSPFVFEEMILCELERRKLSVARSVRYTGDSGVDGRFFINGVLWIIQAKRYSGDVEARDVEAFEACCFEHEACGVFIYTGRTPPAVRSRARQNCKVTIINGERLIAFFAGEALSLASPSLAETAEGVH